MGIRKGAYNPIVSNLLIESGCQINVGISDMRISTNPSDILVTYSLRSCVGVTLYDPHARVGGLIHCLLPDSRSNPERAKIRPYMFVDAGMERMISEMRTLGASPNRMIVKAAGAGVFLDAKGHFDIGKKNYVMLRKVLWKQRLLLRGEAVGGSTARTMFLYMDEGKTIIRTKDGRFEL